MAQSKPGPSPHSVVQPGYASEGKGQSEESLGDLKIQTAVEAWAVAASGVTVSTGGGGAMVEEGAVTVCVRVRPLIARYRGAPGAELNAAGSGRAGRGPRGGS